MPMWNVGCSYQDDEQNERDHLLILGKKQSIFDGGIKHREIVAECVTQTIDYESDGCRPRGTVTL